MADLICPSCARRVPMLRCVAVVFGVRVMSCNARVCIDHETATADFKRSSEAVQARGNGSVNIGSFTYLRDRVKRVAIYSNLGPELQGKLLSAARTAVELHLNPWARSIRELRELADPLVHGMIAREKTNG